jgi:penicillin-binding protein 1A
MEFFIDVDPDRYSIRFRSGVKPIKTPGREMRIMIVSEKGKKKTAKPGEATKPQGKKAKPKKKPATQPNALKRWGRRLTYAIVTLVAVGVIVGGVGGLLAISYFSQDLPPIDSLKNYQPKTVTFFYSDDGRVVGEYSEERRIVVPLAKVPEHVRNAFIAAEDANFYHHQGFDIQAIIRAFIRNLEAGKTKQGGSTITQQVVSTFLLSKEKTYTRKIKEAILAYRITQNLTKDEVLYLYLNQIFLGHGAYGVESAAELFFDKHVDQLTIAEAALLAGMPRAPGRDSPYVNPEAARVKQLYALGQMLKTGFITQNEYDQAVNEKLNFYDRPNPNLQYTPYFTEHVRRLLVDKYGEDRLYTEGFRVYTTVNIEYQALARKAIAEGLREFAKRRPYRGPLKQLEESQVADFIAKQAERLGETPLDPEQDYEAVVKSVGKKTTSLEVQVGPHTGTITKKNMLWALRGKDSAKNLKPGDVVLVRLAEPDKKEKNKKDDEKEEAAPAEAKPLFFTLEQEPRVQSALMSLDLKDGSCKAMVGGRDFRESQFNRAVQSRRQPGSSFKPVIYTAAMDNGFTPGSILIDSPIVYDDFAHGRRWKPTNFDRKFYGPTDLYTGLTSSRNVMAIKLLSKVGYPAVFDTAKRLGIKEELVENLSLALGSVGVSLEEMVSAYSTFPNMGERVEPMYITRIEDRDGNVIEEYLPIKIRAISSGTACVMLHMLEGVVAHGTGTRVKALGRPVGGKTGTTNDLADAWFMGFTPEYVTGVWVGLDEMKRMGFGESGGRAAAPIFLYYMREVLKDKPIRDFPVPPDVEIVNNGSVGICYKAGTVGTGYSEIGGGGGGEEFLKTDLDFDEKDL